MSFGSLGAADGVMKPLLSRLMQPGVQGQVNKAMQAFQGGKSELAEHPECIMQSLTSNFYVSNLQLAY